MRVTSGVRIRKTTTSAGLARLRKTIAKYERRYHCSSDEMIHATKAGTAQETADVSAWLCSYHVLKRLETRCDIGTT